jgi:hypothetical protein
LKVAVLFILLLFGTTLIISIFSHGRLFYSLAAGIIISWIIALVVYYFWAIYFYNVNMGWEDADWQKLDKMKREQPELVEDEPTENPNAEETLGLPPGTVRATLALTLLVGALALMLASLEMPYILEHNHFFIDNYEFLKTAFLMMVAFYFGNKSLEFLKSRNPVYGADGSPVSNQNIQVETLESTVKADEVTIPVDLANSIEIQDNKDTSDFEDKSAQG